MTVLQDLRVKMLSLGYLQYQIDGITYDTIGRTAICNIDDTEAQQLCATYNRCIAFIVKCMKYNK